MVGAWCGIGTSVPNLCPAGTFRGAKYGSQLSDCFPCGPGKYCNDTGLLSPSGSSSQGYYCSLGCTSAEPQNTSTSGMCPPGSYCPTSSGIPLYCSAGRFASSYGQGFCDICPKGVGKIVLIQKYSGFDVNPNRLFLLLWNG